MGNSNERDNEGKQQGGFSETERQQRLQREQQGGDASRQMGGDKSRKQDGSIGRDSATR